MEPNKKELYRIMWTQVYKELQVIVEEEFERLIEETNYKDAKEVINQIKTRL